MDGNTNTYSEVENSLDPPLIAVQRIRIVPFSRHPRTVCMRVELKGCAFSDGVVSYNATAPYKGDRDSFDLADDTYDGVERGGMVSGGLGQLVDGVVGSREDEDGGAGRDRNCLQFTVN